MANALADCVSSFFNQLPLTAAANRLRYYVKSQWNAQLYATIHVTVAAPRLVCINATSFI